MEVLFTVAIEAPTRAAGHTPRGEPKELVFTKGDGPGDARNWNLDASA